MVENGFEELYIITESGQTLFEHSFSNSQKDKDESNQFLLASTLTAILHFIKVSSGQDISNFKFGKHVIYFTRNTDYGILYVLIFPTSKGKMPKDEELRKRLDLIKHNFESKYSKETILG